MTAPLSLLAERFEILAAGAVAHVELTSHDREPHRVRAEKQFAVLDRVAADVARQFARAAAVPARAVDAFSCQLSAVSCRLRAVG